MNDPSIRTEEPSWPYASLFFFGFFGTGSPGGKALAWKTTWSLGLLLVGMSLAAVSHPAVAAAGALAAGLAVLSIGWAYTRYLAGLDELSRMIQLKAFAAAYGAAMVLFALVAAAEMAAPAGASVGPGSAPSVFWIVLAEPIRGAALVVLARRYR